MRYGDFLSSLSLASTHSGGFPYSVYLIRGEPERAPNTRETGSGVYIYIYIYIYLFIYLFVRDLAWQRLNAHAQTPRGSLPLTGKGRHQRR